MPSATPQLIQFTSTSTSMSTSGGSGNLIVVTTSMMYSVPVSVSSWTQNAGSMVTLSGHALAGVAITSQSVLLSGDLVLDLTGIDVYNGMTFTLINATNVTGQWQSVSLSGSTSECIEYQVDVTYTSSQAVVQLTTVSLCFASIESLVLSIALV
jgi:hypothetical protein